MSSRLDDPNLLRSLVQQAKSSHSTQGRALDTALTHQKHLGGDALAPSALSARRRAQQQQLQHQKSISAAWEASTQARSVGTAGLAAADATMPAARRSGHNLQTVTHGTTATATAQDAHAGTVSGLLQVPTLATAAPSFTKAADEGVEALGGTKFNGPGYTSVIGLVPTTDTVQCIDDDYELISSVRPYRYDAKRQSREAALRDKSAPPHPDLLRQLEPTLAAVCPTDMMDVDSLPREYLLHTMQQSARYDDANAEAKEGDEANAIGAAKDEAKARTRDAHGPGGECKGHRAGLLAGTYPFVCLGRPGGDGPQRHLPGQRQPGLGQYNPSYTVVEQRVLGGYIAPNATAAEVPRGRLAKSDHANDDSDATVQLKEGSTTSLEGGNGTQASGTLRAAAATANSREAGGLTATMFSKTLGQTHGEATLEEAPASVPPHKPGENAKGSSMFLSKTERRIGLGTAAPDVVYWPYPDARSTTHRVPCAVQYDVPTHTRRRQPPVSGVPSAVYDVSEDIAANPHRVVDMQSATSRQAHWYGKKWGAERASQRDRQHATADASAFANVDAALRATRPAERAVTLPPRTPAEVDERLRRHREAQQQATTVSVEMDLAYPPPLMGGADKLAKVRDFAHVPGRAQRERVAHNGKDDAAAGRDIGGGGAYLSGPYDDGSHTVDDALAFTEKRQRGVMIDPRAPGHGDWHGTTTSTDIGEVPNLRWVKPNQERTTSFGKGNRRPDHLLPFHDLAYDTEPGYKLIESRVTGDPAMGSVMSRQQRDRIFAKGGCGPKKVLTYDNVDPPLRAKSVPKFEKQITKETQFVGHRIPSERWERKNPKAPGPGYYNVSYKAVE